MNEITRFIRERLDEEEPESVRALPADHPYRLDAERRRRDIESKRGILDEHVESDTHQCGTCVVGSWGYPGASMQCRPESFPCPTLRLLALPYADHLDYDDEWKDIP